ncbi:MAG: hypothetical protein HRU29_13590 [Rhizobiales bacterium]|nr:hypothetical protein [Hyphomicrobiales bacterium]NRB15426.1 hypothetical protein [Hyphomicrobiales bacterium]
MASGSVQLQNEMIAITLEPDFGARVTSLVDLQTGRNWLVAGELNGSQKDDAVFGGQQACGWDECFPTVAPCASEQWNRNLRDHGDMWGRPWATNVKEQAVHCEYAGSGFEFDRIINLVGNSLVVDYQVKNISSARIPYLWSQHCLLAAEPGENIVLDGIENLTGRDGAPDLQPIRSVDANYASKSYSRVKQRASVGIDGANENIRISWLATDLPFFGLWLDFGGWPADGPVHQIAFEPTTAPADDLNEAIEKSNEVWLAPSETRSWQVIFELNANTNKGG